jgi:hypothetical protein
MEKDNPVVWLLLGCSDVPSKEHPRAICYRSPHPILTPDLPLERRVIVANVVFPTGSIGETILAHRSRGRVDMMGWPVASPGIDPPSADQGYLGRSCESLFDHRVRDDFAQFAQHRTELALTAPYFLIRLRRQSRRR